MALFEISSESLAALPATSFDAEGIYERSDLQRHLKSNIGVLASDLMVISEEYGDWEDSNRRVDLLCIDAEANIVVVEIKRTHDGGHMDLQAIRYAAMLSAMTFRQMVDAHEVFLRKNRLDAERAEAEILRFLNWEAPNDELFALEVRIVLAAADFSKEIMTSVMWLNDQSLNIRCIRMKPYKLPGGPVLLDVQQIIPLPEAADFQTRIRAKEQAKREHRVERHEIRFDFWSALLEHANTRTALFAGKPATHAGGFGVSPGRAGLKIGFITRGNDSQAEFEIDFRDGQKCEQMYLHFERNAGEINAAFDGALIWDQSQGRRACYIRSGVEGGWKSPKEDWPRIHQELVAKVIRLNEALKPHVKSMPA